MSHFQDFHVVDIGNKSSTKIAAAVKARQHERTHEQAVLSRLNSTNMGDDEFDSTHAKLEKQQSQFRERLLSARRRLCMNQQQFAHRLNLNKTIIQEIESGKRKAEPGLIQRVQNTLNNILLDM